MLPFIYIGFIRIPMYGLCIACGSALGIYLFWRWAEKWGISKDDAFNAALAAAFGVMLGSKLLYFAVSWQHISENLDYYFGSLQGFLNLIGNGFVFYGGLIGGLLAVWIYCKVRHIGFIHFVDKLVVVVPLIHGFGRIGCFCAGCCYGIPYDGIFKVMFAENSFCSVQEYLFPVQLLESLLLFIIFAIMVILSRKEHRDGFLIGSYLMLYPVVRFFLEYLRYDAERGSFMMFSTSQWISILLFIFGIVLFIRTKNKKLNN